MSRKTGYKWYEQYLLNGLAGLADRSRKPLHQPNAVDEETVGAILEARSRYPSWGERKLKAWLEREHRKHHWPSTSSIGSILQRYGLTRPLLEASFREYGLPARILSDNGPPFASTGVGGLSRLSVWWLRLGIMPERIACGTR